MEKQASAEDLWNIRQASRWLCMSERALRSMLYRDEIPKDAVVRIGRRIRFIPAALRGWIEKKVKA